MSNSVSNTAASNTNGASNFKSAPSPQPSVVVVNSTQALTKAVNNASGPTTIELSPGTYSFLTLYKPTNHGSINIVSQDPSHPSTVQGVELISGQNISFGNLNFDASSTKPGASLVSVYSSSNINFTGSAFHGNANVTLAQSVEGMVIENTNNISVSNSSFYNLHDALNHFNADGLTVANNTFYHLFDDGVRGGGSSDVKVVGNSFTDLHFDASDQSHPDAIQFWTTNTTSAVSNILVENNTYTRGDGNPAQGIFFRDQVGGLPYSNVQILNNTITGSLWNGIEVIDGKNLTVSGNVISSPDKVIVPLIALRDVSNSTLSYNDAPSYGYQNTVNVTLVGNKFTRTNQIYSPLNYAHTLPPAPSQAVPEPTSWLLLIVGFAAIGKSLRRRRDRMKHYSRAV